jgi:hypothetical protein
MTLHQREAKWLKHLKAWQESGITQAAYCKNNKLCPQTFFRWKQRLRDQLSSLPNLISSPIASPNQAAPFVAVNLTNDPIDKPQRSAKRSIQDILLASSPIKSSGISLSIGNQYQISVTSDFDGVALRRLLAVLAG